jgi:hypothetical protein
MPSPVSWRFAAGSGGRVRRYAVANSLAETALARKFKGFVEKRACARRQYWVKINP